MSIKTLLNDEIQNELGELKRIQVGSDEYRLAVDGITKLINQLNEIEKSEIERTERRDNQEMDYDLKVAQFRDEKKDRWIKNGIAIGTVFVYASLAVWGTKTSFKFEETGTVTTTLGRGWLNKLIPKK